MKTLWVISICTIISLAMVVASFSTEDKINSASISANLFQEKTIIPSNLSPMATLDRFTPITIPATPDNPWTNALAWEDLDNDGDLDLAVASQKCESPDHKLMYNHEIYINDNGVFTAIPFSYNGEFTCVAGADYDNDGDMDTVYGPSGHMNILLKNTLMEGSGINNYEDRLWFGARYTGSVAWGDFDRDGDVDLIQGNSGEEIYGRYGMNYMCINRQECYPGLFQAVPLPVHGTHFAAADFDNDGDLDMVSTNGANYQQCNDYLYVNDGNCNFTELLLDPAYANRPFYSITWGDYDNDGDLDLAGGCPGYIMIYTNQLSEGLSPYNFESQSIALPNLETAFATSWGDYNNDGWLDLAVGCAPTLPSSSSQNYLLINAGDGTFGLPTPEFGGDCSTNTIVWGDYDNDGDLDTALSKVFSNGTSQNYIYVNNQNDDDFIILHLVGGNSIDAISNLSNRSAIGAKVQLFEHGHLGDMNYLLGYREICASDSGSGVNALDAHFGIPDSITAPTVDALVTWPDAGDILHQESWTLATGYKYTLDEGSGTAYGGDSIASTTLEIHTQFRIACIYPNPASDQITCQLTIPTAGIVKLELYDLTGRLVLEKQIQANTPGTTNTKLEVSSLSSGVYTLRASCNGADSTARAVVVK